jgi:hypothetical protein
LRAGWPRWSEAAWAVAAAPASWDWLPAALRNLRPGASPTGRAAGVAVRVVLPTAAVGALFAILLGSGNAILAKWISDAWRFALEMLPSFDFAPARFALCIALAWFALALLRPAQPPRTDRIWTRDIPRFPEPRDLTISRWRSLSILALLNALFFAANTTDAIYLWIHGTLPAGVNYSEFVHQGVHSLTGAVLLSAVLLAGMFQQSASVTGSRLLRVLSLAWIAQNVALLASVLLRLKLYVDAYQLSELRVYVGCFLLLVATGFALLAWRIVRDRTLGWLVFANLLATFALFFVVQFLDVRRWVAEYNVARWREDRSRTLDVEYLASLGPSAYRQLIAVAETPGRRDAHFAFQKAQELRDAAREELANLNWRSWQSREVASKRHLATHDIRTERP